MSAADDIVAALNPEVAATLLELIEPAWLSQLRRHTKPDVFKEKVLPLVDATVPQNGILLALYTQVFEGRIKLT